MAAYSSIIRVHYMSSEKKTLKLKTGTVSKSTSEKIAKLLSELYGVNPSRYLPSVLNYTCFNENLCIIYGSKLGLVNLKVLYENSWIAVYTKKRLVPSINIVRSIYSDQGVKAAIIVKEQGVKAFLYGNDILLESVLQVVPPVKKLFAVIDSADNEVIGFAAWNPRRRIYENIYDAGLFLRELG